MPLSATNQKDNYSFTSFLQKLTESNDLEIFDGDKSGFEIASQASDICKSGGKALLFDGDIPIAVNLMASNKRIEQALGMSIQSAADKARQYIDNKTETQLSFTKSPEYEEIKLTSLPIKKHYKGDVSGSVNMGCVISEGYSCGIYRIQPLSDSKAVINCHSDSDLAAQLTKDTPVTIALGTSPHLIYTAAASLPAGIDELLMASYIHPETMLFISTDRFPVPIDTQVIIQATVSATEKHPEGPFFNYTDNYSKVSDFPVMSLESVKMIRGGIYHTTITGKMPTETTYILNAVSII